MKAPVESRVQVILAEYEFVSGLIRYYREIELRALAGAGIVLTAVAAAVGAFESAQEPNRAAEALLLAIAAWVPVVLLTIVLMAKARGWRAARYVRHQISARLKDLGAGGPLFGGGVAEGTAHDPCAGSERELDASRWPVRGLLRGTPIIVALAVCSFALAGAAIWMAAARVEDAVYTWISLGIGVPAAIAAASFTIFGLVFTKRTDLSTQR